MKKFILVALLALGIIGCGGNRTENDTSLNETTNNVAVVEYPTRSIVHDNIDDTNYIHNDMMESESTSLTIPIVVKALQDAGYTITPLSLNQSALRGEVDYQTYLYMTNKTQTVAILGAYTYALSNALGQYVLFNVSGPGEFDSMENSSELVLRANFIDSSSKTRYYLPFAPTGYVNINLSSTLSEMLIEVQNAFGQLTLTNPMLTRTYLHYNTDSHGSNSAIVCNEEEFALDVSQKSVSFGNMFEEINSMVCTTKSGVLIGSIYTPEENGTVISGDLYRSIYETTPQTEGMVVTNKSEVGFITSSQRGTYGSFELLDDGNWKYLLKTNSSVLDLSSGESFAEAFPIQTTDNTTALVEVKIFGFDTIIEGTIAQKVPNSFTGNIDGTLNVLYSKAAFIPQSVIGNYGEFYINSNGYWSYHLNSQSVSSLGNGESVVDIFTVSTTDDTKQEINITIEGKNNQTDFSGVYIHNEYLSTPMYEERGALLKGTIKDADGLASIEIAYSDGTKSIQTDSLEPNATEYTLYNESVYPFGTTFIITVIDGLGNKSTHEATLVEQNEDTQFYMVKIEPNTDLTQGRVVFDIADHNGIDSIKIKYSDSTPTSEYLDIVQPYFHSYMEPEVTYGSTFTIEVLDLLGNIDSYSGTVKETPDYPTDFSGVQIGTNSDGSRYLYGSISDQNGVASISIGYDNSSDYVEGAGDKSVELNDLGSYPVGTSFSIYVYDIQGNYGEPYSGTF
ncbi:MAG: VCBS domain-containing protein [Campylobacterales bacterium]|nr:VCBS domain-containing protein [Campylobacterales bacterium]